MSTKIPFRMPNGISVKINWRNCIRRNGDASTYRSYKIWAIVVTPTTSHRHKNRPSHWTGTMTLDPILRHYHHVHVQSPELCTISKEHRQGKLVEWMSDASLHCLNEYFVRLQGIELQERRHHLYSSRHRQELVRRRTQCDGWTFACKLCWGMLCVDSAGCHSKIFSKHFSVCATDHLTWRRPIAEQKTVRRSSTCQIQFQCPIDHWIVAVQRWIGGVDASRRRELVWRSNCKSKRNFPSFICRCMYHFSLFLFFVQRNIESHFNLSIFFFGQVLTDIGSDSLPIVPAKPIGAPAAHSLITSIDYQLSPRTITDIKTTTSNVVSNGRVSPIDNSIIRETKTQHKTEVLHVDTHSDPIT